MTQLGLTYEIEGAVQQVREGGDASVAISSWVPYHLDVSTDPESIEQGISCGMSWMCGEHPCLCGVADQWGDCACNGFETVTPSVTAETGNPYLLTFQIDGEWYLLGLAPDQSTLTVKADLNHYESAQQSLHVSCGTPGAPALVVIALLIALVVTIVARVQRRFRSKGDEPRL